MAKSYRNYSPVKQFYGMSCWAACLEWWSKYMSPTRPLETQSGLIYEFKRFSPTSDFLDKNYAAMTIDGMFEVLNTPRFKMGTAYISGSTLTPDYLAEKLQNGPAFVVFNDGYADNEAHANIIINCKPSGGGLHKVRAMEPKTPQYHKRFLLDYMGGDVIIAWAKA